MQIRSEMGGHGRRGGRGPAGGTPARRPPARAAGTAVLLLLVVLNASCFVDRSGTGWSIEFDARPTYLCPGESATVSWDAGTVAADRSFDLTLLRRPGAALEPPRPVSTVDSTTFVPREPADPSGVRDTEVTGVFSGSSPTGDGTRLRSLSDRVLVLGPDAAYPHRETFTWGCDNAAGGGPGYSRVDYTPGEVGSERIRLARIQNLSPVSVRVSLVRAGLSRDRIATRVLPPGGVSGDDFAGPLVGVLTAVPEDLGDYGPDGCDSGGEPGDVVSGDGEEPVVIRERPEVELELELRCAPS